MRSRKVKPAGRSNQRNGYTGLEDDCTLINKSPYEKGWIMVVKPSTFDEELQQLFHGTAVESWIKKEIQDAEKKKK